MKGAARDFSTFGMLAIKIGRWSGLAWSSMVFAEFKRAVAAEQRYEKLRRLDATALAREGASRADVPRMVFREFYALRRNEPDRRDLRTRQAR